MNNKTLLFTIASGFVAVLLGAFGAHALKNIAPLALIDTWKTASFYHFIHTVVLLIIILKQQLLTHLGKQLDSSAYNKVVIGFFAGMILFSGSLYLYVLSQIKLFAMVTPIGGVILLLSWAYWFKTELFDQS